MFFVNRLMFLMLLNYRGLKCYNLYFLRFPPKVGYRVEFDPVRLHVELVANLHTQPPDDPRRCLSAFVPQKLVFLLLSNYYCANITELWVRLLALKVRAQVRFSHPFSKYALYSCALKACVEIECFTYFEFGCQDRTRL